MTDIADAVAIAFQLILGLDGALFRIVSLSLSISLSAVAIAGAIGLPVGAALSVFDFPGRRAAIVVVNGFLGLPPVVVGLFVYLMLSRSGPLGVLGLLFPPAAMIVAQTILVAPIVIALVHRAVAEAWATYGDTLLVDGASKLRALSELLAIARSGVVTAVLAGFGRAIAEVGAIIIVGGNIAGATRTMTTAIALETSKGNLPLALGLGIILITLSVAVSAVAFVISRRGINR
ncbi:MAG: ABC transporter permease [Proteobacteria bacterium]|nr:ABC transporter permease [Pseudomonadota bacterium]MBI3497260.1 ABC transporter permease [Pseudomonadota bacterium]